MNLYTIISKLQNIATTHKLVNEVSNGDIYEWLNSGEHKYGCVFTTITNITEDENQMQTVNLNIFYVDRLLADKTNELQIQSVAVTTLKQILKKLEDTNSSVVISRTNFVPFTEKFADFLAGAYCGLALTFDSEVGCVGSDEFIEPEPEPDYLTFTSEGNSTISMTNNGGNTPNVEYSTDDGATWTEWDYSAISLSDGQKVQMRGLNPSGFSHSGTIYSKFVMSGSIYASGNIMTLIDKTGDTLTIPDGNGCFKSLFANNSALKTAPKLPATKLSTRCYYAMFGYCTSLVTAPELPANELEFACYEFMFDHCTHLENVPDLKATILDYACYYVMFGYCTSLVNAPALPADTLEDRCYNSMFEGCTSLVNAPALPATVLATGCYANMFNMCVSLASAPEFGTKNLNEYMSCTNMFYGCSALNYIKCLATTIENSSMSNWVSGVAATGTFVKAEDASWSIGTSGIPVGWTVEEE